MNVSKYWVFDLDGTLVDSFPHFFSSLETIFHTHGSVFTPKLKMPALTEPLFEFFEKHLGKSAAAPAMERLHAQGNSDAERIRAFPGIQNVFQFLRSQESRIAVWTNRDLISAQLILKHSGLSHFVELCVSGSCVQKRKPHAEGLSKIIEHFGCDPKQVTMVGDHDYDVAAAQALGAQGIRASWHPHWEMAPCQIAPYQFRTVEAFYSWLQSPHSH